MARAVHVRKARKDYPEQGIKKGDEYWHWAFMQGGRGGPIIRSRTKPRRSQLTQSAFKSALYDLQDGVPNEAPLLADMEGERDSLRDELQNISDEQEGNLENMPEGLQQGDTGQMLQTRIDSLQDAISTLEGIDCDGWNPDDGQTEEEWRESTWDEIHQAVDTVEEG